LGRAVMMMKPIALRRHTCRAALIGALSLTATAALADECPALLPELMASVDPATAERLKQAHDLCNEQIRGIKARAAEREARHNPHVSVLCEDG
jgi:hypothetical protein